MVRYFMQNSIVGCGFFPEQHTKKHMPDQKEILETWSNRWNIYIPTNIVILPTFEELNYNLPSSTSGRVANLLQTIQNL